MVHVLAREYFKEGGYRSLPTVADMHDIPMNKRKEGMLIRVTNEHQFYILEGGITNNSFKPIQLGGGGGAANLSGYLTSADADKKYYTKQEVDAAIEKAVEDAMAEFGVKLQTENLGPIVQQAVTAAIAAHGAGAPAAAAAAGRAEVEEDSHS